MLPDHYANLTKYKNRIKEITLLPETFDADIYWKPCEDTSFDGIFAAHGEQVEELLHNRHAHLVVLFRGLYVVAQ